MDNELGGFAEEPKFVSDAYTEEEQLRDFECFNYCLAEDYASAMYTEDFEALGDVDDYLFRNICDWINYNPNLGNAELKEQIENGTLITNKNRTFLSAIAANKNVSWGEIYINYRVYSPEIIVMLIEASGASQKVLPICLNTKDEEELHKLNMAIYLEIEKRYQENGSLEYLKTIQRGYGILHTKKDQKSLKIPTNLSWARTIKEELNKK